MKVTFSSKAEKQYRKLSKFEQIIIARKFPQLGTKELPATKLSGFPNLYRVRIGNYRIAYRLEKGTKYIVGIGHRKEVYKMLDKLFGLFI